MARTQNRNHKVINKVIHSQEIDREKYRDNCNRKMTSFSLEANTTDLTNHSPLVTRFIKKKKKNVGVNNSKFFFFFFFLLTKSRLQNHVLIIFPALKKLLYQGDKQLPPTSFLN